MAYEGPKGPPTTEWLLLHDYNLNAAEGTKYEEWAAVAADEMHMFANIETPMNILTLFTAE